MYSHLPWQVPKAIIPNYLYTLDHPVGGKRVLKEQTPPCASGNSVCACASSASVSV